MITINHVSSKNLKFAYNRLKKKLRRRQCNPLITDEEFNPYSEEWINNFIECDCFDLYVGSIQFAEIFNHLLINFKKYFENDITLRSTEAL